jgi:hypothetical protein
LGDAATQLRGVRIQTPRPDQVPSLRGLEVGKFRGPFNRPAV